MKANGTPALPVDKGGNNDDGPWIVLLKNFISNKEADTLIAAGHEKEYECSSDVGVENPHGMHKEEVSNGCTPHNSGASRSCASAIPSLAQ